MIRIEVDGRPVEVVEGQSLAGALHAAGTPVLRHNLVSGEPRAPFCGMGVCFECEVVVDGLVDRACLVHVRTGMRVRTGGVDVARHVDA